MTQSDLISRQAAIDIVQGYAERLHRYIGMPNDSETYAYARGLLLSIERNINALPSAQPEHGRWIPCNERLPEIGDTYIVTGIQKDPHEKEWHYFVDVASSHGDYIDDYWDTFNDWIEGQETHIVAWMPLPEPYKMGGDEE